MYEDFDVSTYECLSRPENGGLNWIIPHKFLAFMAPADKGSSKEMSAEDYAGLFKQLGVSAVIQLNKEKYDTTRFVLNGINYQELYFHDGSVPEDSLVSDFYQIVGLEKGAVAVHCKAGLGRTGTLIGCYAIRHFGFTGAEIIGWARLCRPGSVLGPQQYFLCEYEEKVKNNGRGAEIGRATSPTVPMRGEMTLFEKYRAKFGDMGQAERLIQIMKSAPSSPSGAAGRPGALRDFGKLRIPISNKRDN